MYTLELSKKNDLFSILARNYENNFIPNVFEKVFLDQKPNVA